MSKIKCKNYQIFDFETTGEKFYNLNNRAEVRMVATSAFVRQDTSFINPKIHIHYNTREWLKFILAKRHNTIFYANNLRNFDGEFLLNILNENLDLIDEIKKEDYDKKSSLKKLSPTKGLENYNIGDKAIKVLANEQHKIITIKIRTKDNKILHFKCLLQLLSMSVKNMMTILKMEKEIKEIKENEDYSVYDCSKDEFNERLKDKKFKEARDKYIKMDVLVCYRYIQLDRANNKFSPFEFHKKIPLTAATHAWETGKKLIKEKNSNDFIFNNYFLGEWVCKEHKNSFHKKLVCFKNEKMFDSVLTSVQYETFSQLSRGGITFLNNKYRNKELENVHSIDRNSHYPSEYCLNKMPYGKPKELTYIPQKKDRFNMKYSILVNLWDIKFIKDKDIFPPMMPKGRDNSIEGRFIYKYNGEIQLLVWEEEWELFKKYYKFNYEIIKVYVFKMTSLIGKAIRPLVDIKFTTKNPALKQGTKLLINSFYGKWIEKNLKRGKEFIYNEDDGIKIVNTFNSTKCKKWKFPPVGNYIASLCRVRLYEKIEEIVKIGGKVIYGDTDSIKFMGGDISKITGLGSELGEWDMEWIDYKMKYLAPKCYAYFTKGQWYTKMKGYTSQVNYEDFKYGMKLDKRLTGRRVNGGKVLFNMEYTINKNKNLIGDENE